MKGPKRVRWRLEGENEVRRVERAIKPALESWRKAFEGWKNWRKGSRGRKKGGKG